MVEQLIPRRKFRIKSKEFGDQWQVVSYQKQASDVELTGGETVQQRIDRLIALVTELTTTITNTKSAEAQTHSELENEMNLLEADLKNGIREVEHELLNLDVEGDGAEDFTRLKTATENLKTATETKLDQLKLDVDELLNYELDPSMTNIYDYLSDRIDRLRQHIELLLSGLSAIIGDGDITDVLYNAGIEITDTTDTSLVAALKQHHSKLIAQAAYYNDIGNMAPPYAWQKFEYDHNTPAADSLVTVEVSNISLTVNWHFVFYYLPVFKLLKVTGYVNLLQNGGTDPVGVNVHILNKKLRLMYADSYQTMTNTYSSLPYSDNLFIDHRQGVLMTDPADTKTFGFGYYDGAFGIKQVDFFGISMGDDEDVVYRPSGFNVWSTPTIKELDLTGNFIPYYNNLIITDDSSIQWAKNEYGEDYQLELNIRPFGEWIVLDGPGAWPVDAPNDPYSLFPSGIRYVKDREFVEYDENGSLIPSNLGDYILNSKVIWPVFRYTGDKGTFTPGDFCRLEIVEFDKNYLETGKKATITFTLLPTHTEGVIGSCLDNSSQGIVLPGTTYVSYETVPMYRCWDSVSTYVSPGKWDHTPVQIMSLTVNNHNSFPGEVFLLSKDCRCKMRVTYLNPELNTEIYTSTGGGQGYVGSFSIGYIYGA